MSTLSESSLQPTSELLGGDSNTIKNVAIVGVSTTRGPYFDTPNTY